MPSLTSTRVVATLLDATGRDVVFGTSEDPRYHVITPRQVWDDMGKPETITATIEPGDLLNG